MSILTQEVRNIQNPALGAGLLWRFACGYVAAHPTAAPVPLPLLFLVLPITLHEPTEGFVSGTRKTSGLRAFAGKFGDAKNSRQDVLLAIHGRTLALRSLTVGSLRLALGTRLVHLDGATVIPLSATPAHAGIPQTIRGLMTSSEKLGSWCGVLTLHEIAAILKVRF
jgi:hypothetical protein